MRMRIALGSFAGLTACATWAYSLAVFQPMAEARTWTSDSSGWPRDLRHGAMFLAFAGFVLIAEGRLTAVAYGLAGVAAWFAADIYFDRLNLDAFAAGIVAVVILAVFGMGGWYLTQIGIVRPDNRRPLFFWAIAAVAMVPFMTYLIIPPFLAWPEVGHVSAAIAAALLLTACGLAAEASGNVEFGRLLPLAVLLPAAGALIAYRRAAVAELFTDLVLTYLALSAAVISLIWLANRLQRRPGAYFRLALAFFPVIPFIIAVAMFGALLASLAIGQPMARLAGHPLGESYEPDLMMGVAGFFASMLIAAIISAGSARADSSAPLSPREPVPAPAEVA